MGKTELVFQERESGQKPRKCAQVTIDLDTERKYLSLRDRLS